MVQRNVDVKFTGDSTDAINAVNKLNSEWEAFQQNVAQPLPFDTIPQARPGGGLPSVKPGGGLDDVGRIGNVASAFAAVSGELDAGSQAALRFAGDVAGAAEKIPQFAQSFTGIIGALNPIGAVVTGVAIAAGVAVAQIIAANEALSASISASIEANASIERKVAEGLTFEQATAEIERLTKARDAEQQIVNKEAESREQAANAAASQFGILSGAVLGFVNATSSAEQTSADTQAEAQKRVQQYNAEITRLNEAIAEGELAANDAAEAEKVLAAAREQSANQQATAIREVNTAIAGGLTTDQLTQQIEQTRAAIQSEVEIRERLTALGLENTDAFKQSLLATDQLTIKLGELESNTTKAAAAANTEAAEQEKLTANLLSAAEATAQADAAIARFTERQEDLAASRALQDARAAEDAAINRVQREQDLQRQLEQQHEQHQQRIEQIEAAGNERIAQLRQALADKEAETLQRIADIQASFAAEQARKEFEFQRDQLRAQQEYDEQRLQIQRNTNDSLFDALLANDVTAALRAKREGDQALGDLDSNFTQEQQRARDDFEYQRQLDEQAKNEQLANLQAELDAFRAATAEKIKAEQEAIEQRKAAEIAAYEEQLKRDAELRAIQQEREEQAAELRRQRLEEDRRIQDEAAQAALDKELANIAAKSEAEQAVYDAAIAKIEQLGLAVAAIGVPPGSVPGNASGAANKDLYGGGGYPVKDLGDGTVVPDSASGSALPDFAVPSSGGNASPMTVQLTLGQINLGENVSQRELQEVAMTIATETKKAVESVMFQTVRSIVETA